jgi:hypothetical protein
MSPRRQEGTLFAIRDTCYLKYRITESKDGTCTRRAMSTHGGRKKATGVFRVPSKTFAARLNSERRSSERNRASNISRLTSATALLKPMSLAMGNRFLRSLTSSRAKAALKHISALGSSIFGHLTPRIEFENFLVDRMRSTGVPFFDSKTYPLLCLLVEHRRRDLTLVTQRRT